MLYGILAAVSALIVIADQVTKYLVVKHIALYEAVPVWNKVFHLTYIQNTGMGFSLLEGYRWLFIVMTLAAFVLIFITLKKKWITHPTGLWALAFIAGGAVGNLIDRIRLGYVVDMICVDFIDFPVFNVADCFVVCGAILLVVYTFFFDKPKKETAADASDSGQEQ